MNPLVKYLVTVSTVMLLAACASNQPPAQTTDGLVLLQDTRFKQVYQKPGADVTGYADFGLAPCQVAFRRNWLRDQNTSRVDLTNRVTQQDVDRIKDSLAALCDEKFREALLAEPAYHLVDKFDDGERVAVLSPSIINLDINAPDIKGPGMSRSYTTSAGEMTLSLELSDATTGEVLYRVIDRRKEMDTGYLQWTTSVSNRADASRTLSLWSRYLREGLDDITGR